MISPYIAEFVGTSILLLLGSGIVANVSLSKTKGFEETPLITITTAWGFAVFVAAYITVNLVETSHPVLLLVSLLLYSLLMLDILAHIGAM